MAEATLDLATVWDQIRERLATSLSPQQNAMLNLTRPLGLVEDTAVLAAPNEFTQTVLESRMRRVLAEALSEQFGRDIRVAVQLEDAPAEAPDEDRDEEPTRRPWSAAEAALEAQRAEEDRASRDRADDGRSAFGVRTDAVGSAPWDRDAADDAAPAAAPPTSASCGRPTAPGAPGRPRRARGLGHHHLGRSADSGRATATGAAPATAAPPTSCPSTSTAPAATSAPGRAAATAAAAAVVPSRAARRDWTRA